MRLSVPQTARTVPEADSAALVGRMARSSFAAFFGDGHRVTGHARITFVLDRSAARLQREKPARDTDNDIPVDVRLIVAPRIVNDVSGLVFAASIVGRKFGPSGLLRAFVGRQSLEECFTFFNHPLVRAEPVMPDSFALAATVSDSARGFPDGAVENLTVIAGNGLGVGAGTVAGWEFDCYAHWLFVWFRVRVLG